MNNIFRKLAMACVRPGKDRTFCPICDMSNMTFVPLPDYFRVSAKEHGYKYFGRGEMIALDTYSCPNCGASDRERIYAYWLKEKIKYGKFSRLHKMIHFAPEQALSNFIRKIDAFEDYQTADLMMEGVDHKVDLMDLPFADDSYDFFICSHVLEHIPDDNKAIRELFRITRPGGCGILMAPIVIDLTETLEDTTANSDSDRWRLFGQFDHVRIYAHDDYVQRIVNGGFLVEQLGCADFGAEIFSKIGLKETSILYIVTKK